jgi:23S rRNA (cytidine2498-2'-O)-methyltransferase
VTTQGRSGFLAAEGYEQQLREELGETGIVETHGRLLLVEGASPSAAWAANTWRDPQTIAIASIADGAKKLRALQRNWALYACRLHRRARLIQEQLPHVSAKPLVFPQAAPTAPLGSWTLADENTILAAAQCSSPFPNGEVQFVEDKTARPTAPI